MFQIRLSCVFASACALACTEPSPDPAPEEGAVPVAEEPVPEEAAEVIDPVAVAWQQALTSHRGESYVGELGTIKKRGVLRVGMLNNAASYFIYRGQQVGFQLEMAELLAARMAVRLQVVVPPQPSDMVRLLREGKVDVIPMGQADAAADDSLLHTEPFIFANHVLVQPADAEPVRSEGDLAGKQVHVRRSSRYRPFLKDIQRRVPTLKIVDADESLETEELIDRVAGGVLPMTAANTILLGVELTHRDDVKGSLTIAEDQGLVYAVSHEAPQLAERLAGIVARDLKSDTYERIYAKYFEDRERMAELRAGKLGASGEISPYDDLAKRFGAEHDIDWRLILAQMYQESRFDPRARSFAGARGLMQLMPATARELGVSDIVDPEQNVGAGVKYLRSLIDRFEPELPIRQRIRFALASYNAGFYHVKDARLLASQQGLDPDRWFGNVERAIQLLEHRRYYRKAKFGYCRGREPAQYVSRIQSRYEGFAELTAGQPSRNSAGTSR